MRYEALLAGGAGGRCDMTGVAARLDRLERAANPPHGGSEGRGCPQCRGWADGEWLWGRLMELAAEEPTTRPDACPSCGRRPRKELCEFTLFDVLKLSESSAGVSDSGSKGSAA